MSARQLLNEACSYSFTMLGVLRKGMEPLNELLWTFLQILATATPRHLQDRQRWQGEHRYRSIKTIVEQPSAVESAERRLCAKSHKCCSIGKLKAGIVPVN
jgi:hypothetical protein